MTKQNPSYTTLPETGFLRLPQILRLIPIGKSTWWSWVACGKAPPAVKLGAKTTAWRAEDIYKLLDRYTPQRNGGAK